MILLSLRYLKGTLSVAQSICLSFPLESSKSQYLTQHQQLVVTKDTGKFRITLQWDLRFSGILGSVLR